MRSEKRRTEKRWNCRSSFVPHEGVEFTEDVRALNRLFVAADVRRLILIPSIEIRASVRRPLGGFSWTRSMPIQVAPATPETQHRHRSYPTERTQVRPRVAWLHEEGWGVLRLAVWRRYPGWNAWFGSFAIDPELRLRQVNRLRPDHAITMRVGTHLLEQSLVPKRAKCLLSQQRLAVVHSRFARRERDQKLLARLWLNGVNPWVCNLCLH